MISIVLVHYHAQDLLEKAIFSIYQQKGGFEMEFLITDNSQNFDTKNLDQQQIPYSYFDLAYNAGFARGVNQGLRNAKGETIFIVNQDAYFSSEPIVLRLMERINSLPPKTMLGCSLVDENDAFQESVWIDNPGIKRIWKKGAIYCKLFPNWQEKMEQEKKEIHAKTGFVPRINGAFIVFQKPKKLNTILFDEDFFLYGEDVEWALRIQKSGWKFFHDAGVVVHHLGSASSSDSSLKLRQIELMDWLVLLKTKGKWYLKLYISLLFYLKKLDLWLCSRNAKKDKLLFDKAQEQLDTLIYLQKNYLQILLDANSNTTFFDELNEYKKKA